MALLCRRFYKIPVTTELVKAVESGGKYSEEETVFYAYRPEVPKPRGSMKPLGQSIYYPFHGLVTKASSVF
jgi:hypothetical protein